MSRFAQALTKFRGGVSVPHHKSTSINVTVNIEQPEMVVIPMQQHIGTACQPAVKNREVVAAGQVIGLATGYVSAPIHAPVSGKVKGIKPILLSNGKTCEAIHIENDGLMTYQERLQPVSIRSRDDLLQAAYDSGLVGIGGAGFPLHVKLANQDGLPIDQLIINGAECEPYITSDYREMIEFPERVIAGAATLMNYLGIEKGIIGIEGNKPEAIQVLSAALETGKTKAANLVVMELPTRYPQGAEKMLVYAATGRKIGTGKLPSHVGCLVLNVSTVSLFQKYLETGIPLTHKRLTVAGDNLVESKNLLVPIGTTIRDILSFCGGLKEESGKIILGGPMMGIAQFTLDLPITKQNNAVIALRSSAELPEEYPCIRCGRCITACPLALMPVQVERFSKTEDAEMLHKLNVAACMECGCCSYACPSGRKLVQYMKQAKVIERRLAK